MKKYIASKCEIHYWEEDVCMIISVSNEPSEDEQLIIDEETTFEGDLFHLI